MANITPCDILNEKILSGEFNFVIFKDTRKCFVVIDPDTKEEYGTVKGVNPVLRSIFYSNYKFDFKKMKVHEDIKKLKATHEKPDNLGVRLGPISRGSIVHDQIRIKVNLNKSEYAKNYTYVDPMTDMFFKWMKVRNLEPVISELPICDPSIKLGTAADMIASDEFGNLYLIEIKTGNYKTFHAYNGHMESGLEFMENSPFNHGRLQLVTTYQILKRIYDVKIKKCILVHISDDGVNEKFIKEGLIQLSDEIYDVVSNVLAKG